MPMLPSFITITSSPGLIGCKLLFSCLLKRILPMLLLGRFFFQKEEYKENITKGRALSIFEDVFDGSKASEFTAIIYIARYRTNLKNHAQPYLISDYLKVEVSFRMASRFLAKTKESTRLPSLGSVSEETMTAYARSMCALNLQLLRELLTCVWTFLLAMDMSTHMSTLYLNIYIRLRWNCGYLNFHSLAIPLFTRHTG